MNQSMTKNPQALLARARGQAAGQAKSKPMRTPPIMDPSQRPGGGGTMSGGWIPPGGPNTKFQPNPAINMGQRPPGAPQPPGANPDAVKMMGGENALMQGLHNQGGQTPGGGGQSPPIVSMPGAPPQFGTAGQHLGLQQPGQGEDQQQQQSPGGQPAWQQLQQMGIAGQGSAAANQAMLAQHQQQMPQVDPMAAVNAALQARQQIQGQGGPQDQQMQGQPGQMPTGMHPPNPQGMPGGGGFQGPQNLSQIYSAKPMQPSVSYAPGGMSGQPGQMPTGRLPPPQPPPRPGGMGGLAQRPFTPQ